MFRNGLTSLLTRAALGLVVVCESPQVCAEEPTPEKRVREAEALLREGVSLRRAHRDQEALDTFQRALALEPTLIARAQVALAEQALGHWLEAERELKIVLQSKGDPWVETNRAALENARLQIDRHLAWLQVNIDLPATELRFEGHPLQAHKKTRVLGRSGVLEARADGYVPYVQRIELAPGTHAQIVLSLTPLAAKQPASAAMVGTPDSNARERPTASTAMIGPIALGTIAVTALGIGTYYGIRTFDQKRARDEDCSRGACTSAAVNHDADARTSATVSTVAISVGLASTAAAVTWWLLGNRRRTSTPTLRAAPFAGWNAAGFRVEGTIQ
jgi:hypothetical protein